MTEFDVQIAALRNELLALISSNDLRYQQRFDAQGKALDAAFGAARGAVDAALAASDKAAVKTEISADKRFSDLGELIKEQFRSMGIKIDSANERIKALEDRLNTSSGELSGSARSKDDTRGLWAIGISTLLAILALISFLLRK